LPWKVTDTVQERERLMKAWVSGRFTVTELAAAFGVSRKTAYKVHKRFLQGGLEALNDRPPVAHHHPRAVPAEVVAAVVRAKQARPLWGPLKLLPGPDEPADIVARWPAPSTRGAILAREGLTRPRRRRRRVPPNTEPFRACHEPNDLWCADFKGWFRTRDGARCDPLTVMDAYSRNLLCCRAVPRTGHEGVRPVFEALFREYGLPLAIRSDNGPPFASTAAGGLSALSIWWLKLGIWPDRIDPGHPEQNGRHERMHLTLKLEGCQPPQADLQSQQLSFDTFRQTYNRERPHQALGLETPSRLYRPSPRLYPDRLEDPVYPPDVLMRRVRSNGEIRWRGGLIFISETLCGEAIAISETELGYAVHFGPILLGRLDARQERLVRPTPPLRHLRSVTHARS
jgi:putative transposase